MIFDPTNLPDYAARMEAARLYEEFCRLDDAKDAFTVGTQEHCDAYGKMEDAFEAYENYGVDLLTDIEGNLIRCALTGVPLLAEATDTEFVLAAAVKGEPDLDQEAA